MTKSKKKMSVVLRLQCSCANQWTAIFAGGIVSRKVVCPKCYHIVPTRGELAASAACAGCSRSYTKQPCEFCNSTQPVLRNPIESLTPKSSRSRISARLKRGSSAKPKRKASLRRRIRATERAAA